MTTDDLKLIVIFKEAQDDSEPKQYAAIIGWDVVHLSKLLDWIKREYDKPEPPTKDLDCKHVKPRS